MNYSGTRKSAAIILLTLLLIPFRLYADDGDSLEDLYKQELDYLDRELETVRRRIEEVRHEGTRRLENIREEIRRLETDLLQAEDRTKGLSAGLDAARASGSGGTDTAAALESLSSEIRRQLDGYAYTIAPPEGSTPEERIIHTLRRVEETLESVDGIYSEESSFYLSDGTEVRGTVIHIGGIASYGLHRSQGGSLAPAGDGTLRLAGEGARNEARLLDEGKIPASLTLYLPGRNRDEAVLPGESSFRDTLRDGGVIGGIILVLGALGAVLVILRILTLARVERKTDQTILPEVIEMAGRGQYREARETAAGNQDSATGRVVHAALEGLVQRSPEPEDMIAEAILREQPLLERFRHIITVLASVAPLLGLLGTVTGIISTFDIITLFGSGDPKLLSGGISEALVTTEFGLAVAIPLLLVGNVLSGWADRLLSRLETTALEIINAGREHGKGTL